ncbi:DciA family protein [Puniceicoccus vermicola]|uniref:DUF721 domain-containing protein n=1 Tax=Puniceicoccus vermicola TaxID=388746 RepID=A0A7X1E3G9_9BACT|nr:DUF721 domain-containing protein [Puniceicoccus vermicola]MBC2601475.1 DUF721 domain-containing protein [Puniceicoccus vermicola]
MASPHPKKHRPFSAEDLAVIDRFRGLPRNPIRKTRKPNDLASSMDRILSSLRVTTEKTPEQTILQSWEYLIGKSYAKRCAPGRIERDGTFIILAPNPIIRQELSLQKRRLLFKIRKLPGCLFVRSILLRGG